MFLSEVTILYVAVAVLASYVAGQFIFRKDDEIEKRRTAAFNVATKLSEYGLVRVPGILRAYAIGDYSKMAEEIKDAATLLTSSEDAVVKELRECADRVVDHLLTTPEGRALFAAKLNAAEKVA